MKRYIAQEDRKSNDSFHPLHETYARRGRHGSLSAAFQHIRQFELDLQQTSVP